MQSNKVEYYILFGTADHSRYDTEIDNDTICEVFNDLSMAEAEMRKQQQKGAAGLYIAQVCREFVLEGTS